MNFDELFSAHNPAVLSCLKRRGCPDPESFAQAAWLKAWKRLQTYKPEMSFRNWILTIAQNTWKTAQSRKGGWIPAMEAFDRPTEEDNALEEAEAARFAVELLAQLPKRQREVLELVYFKGCSRREVAKQYGCSHPTISDLVDKALKALRERMAA